MFYVFLLSITEERPLTYTLKEKGSSRLDSLDASSSFLAVQEEIFRWGSAANLLGHSSSTCVLGQIPLKAVDLNLIPFCSFYIGYFLVLECSSVFCQWTPTIPPFQCISKRAPGQIHRYSSWQQNMCWYWELLLIISCIHGDLMWLTLVLHSPA